MVLIARKLDAILLDFQEDWSSMAGRAGFFRDCVEHLTTQICDLAPPARGGVEDRRIGGGLEEKSGICIPPFNLIPNCLSKVMRDQAGSDRSILAEPSLVPNSDGTDLGYS